MSESEVAAASAYEELLVPALFAEWAPRVAAAASLEPGDRVLDVGCGTGVLARVAEGRVSPNGSVAGLDANAGMLAVAARQSPDIVWRQGTAESLPFPDASFDAVVSQFSVMFFRDRPKALQEMTRVLRSHGRVAVAVWDSLERNPAYATEVDLLRRTSGDAGADAMTAPFVLGDKEVLALLTEDAGWSSVEITTRKGVGHFPSIRAMVTPDLVGWLPVMGVHLDPETVERVLDAAEEALRPYTVANGEVVFECSAHIITAVKPQAEV